MRIENYKERAHMLVGERMRIYDDLSKVLNDYEKRKATEDDLYDMLVEIQNSWDAIITAEQEMRITYM